MKAVKLFREGFSPIGVEQWGSYGADRPPQILSSWLEREVTWGGNQMSTTLTSRQDPYQRNICTVVIYKTPSGEISDSLMHVIRDYRKQEDIKAILQGYWIKESWTSLGWGTE